MTKNRTLPPLIGQDSDPICHRLWAQIFPRGFGDAQYCAQIDYESVELNVFFQIKHRNFKLTVFYGENSEPGQNKGLKNNDYGGLSLDFGLS